MNAAYVTLICRLTGIGERQVRNTVELLESGCTVPFISRYRKEATGSLDEVQVADISAELQKLNELSKRKETILSTIDEQGHLTDELRQRIDACWDATELEDIYAPYKPHRRTRADMAREKGLEPLADMLMKQNPYLPLQRELGKYIGKNGVMDADDALQGARDIIAERIAVDEGARNILRSRFRRSAVICSKVVKGKETDGIKYRDWFDFSEPLGRCASHRLLAMRRGETEGFLRVNISIDADEASDALVHRFVRGHCEASEQMEMAVRDSSKRLLMTSIENEFAALSAEKADTEAIRIFARNLEQLLMASPLGEKRVMGIDPGFRTGCKVVCLDKDGTLLHNETIYPHPPVSQHRQAESKVVSLVRQYHIEAIAIGNGTAGRETEAFVNGLHMKDIEVYSVNEDGASIYSASKTAREEFPDYDVTVRGAVSIGRRLMDPLAELVKIDASSLGVGQYQKDVDQKQLKMSLDRTVESCVNRVGVNVNTASCHLLTYVSGLGQQLASNIVAYRRENGAFRSRKELMKVSRMGPKAYEQCAGFLRIRGGEQPLDNSAVHPESYSVVEKMAHDLGCTVETLMKDAELRKDIDLQRYVTDKVGLPTLNDIMAELARPGLDPREQLHPFAFSDEVHRIEDVHSGMVLPGIVTNITNFGAFVDIGVHTKGLIHVSEMAEGRFVSNPNEIVSIGQQLQVRVIDVDLERSRISLSLKL